MGRRKSKPDCFGKYFDLCCTDNCGWERDCEEEYGMRIERNAVVSEKAQYLEGRVKELERENDRLKQQNELLKNRLEGITVNGN